MASLNKKRRSQRSYVVISAGLLLLLSLYFFKRHGNDCSVVTSYIPSDFEKNWSGKLKSWEFAEKEDYCSIAALYKNEIQLWIDHIKKWNSDEATAAPSLFSTLTYSLKCGHRVKQQQALPIEPLSFALRHPLDICERHVRK